VRIGRQRTLRRTLVLSAILVVGVAAAAAVGAVSLFLSQRDALERDAEAQRREQRIAEQIVALTFEQQLDAYRYLERGDSSQLAAFRDRGERAYGQIRQYLFNDLPPTSRLQVEQIKETHEQFEVAAFRAFELAARGQPEAARRRLGDLDERTAALGAAVDEFLATRGAQRETFRTRQEAFARRTRVGLGVAAIALFALVVLLGMRLRQRVLRPLDDLTAASRRLGTGDLDARVPTQPYAEFDEVATGFNQMADNVRAARETMEAQNEEIRQTLDHLQRTQMELVQHEKLSAMGQMLAGLAHELNNPLAGVVGMAELLRAELAESDHAPTRVMASAFGEPLEREARRAGSLVRNLLNFARRPSGVVEPVGLAAAVSTALGLCAHAYAEAEKTIQVHLEPTLHVMADAQKLQHAIVNVVNNALDAIVAAGGRGLAIVAAREGEDQVRVTFDDDGMGFVDPDAALVPFYTTKEAGKGTGLGLALVEQFVHEFGGSVAVSNRSAGGARVSLMLRRADDDATASAAHAPAAAEASRGARRADEDGRAAGTFLEPRDRVPPERDAAVAPRVLVVDDEPTLRTVQGRLLSGAGIEVVLAATGAEAREVLAREHFDLVISDLRMPGEMDGRELLAWLEETHPALAARALLLTGDVNGVASVALPVPAERVLTKPFNNADYVRRVRRALGLLDE
jgi:signal transduction histidine kinase/CheY-like chemotaxis protein